MNDADRVRYCPNQQCPQLCRDGRPAEYRAQVETCAECGTPLVAEPVRESQSGGGALESFGTIDPGEPLTTVAIFNEPVALQHAAALLEGRGIPFLVAGSHASVLFGSSSAVQQRLQVPQSRAEEASEVLAAEGLALRRPDPQPSATVRELERQERRRTGVPPLVWLLLWAVLLGLWLVLGRGP